MLTFNSGDVYRILLSFHFKDWRRSALCSGIIVQYDGIKLYVPKDIFRTILTVVLHLIRSSHVMIRSCICAVSVETYTHHCWPMQHAHKTDPRHALLSEYVFSYESME